MTDYLNRPDVRAALNIPTNIQAWSQCGAPIDYHYSYEGSVWIYPILKAYGYKLLHYSGDTDGAITTYGTRRWIKELNMPVSKPWRPWKTDGQISGYVIDYDNFQFVTVHGVGHMAPQWKRKDVTQMITNFIHNLPIA